MSTTTIVARQLDRETFAPFGEVLGTGTPELPIDLYDGTIELTRPGELEADQPVEFLLLRSSVRPLRLKYIERHHQLTQTFIPLAGHPFVAVVARPDARIENGVPAPDEVNAFVVPGDAGINIHRGTWHEPPFPLVEGGLTICISHRALTQGLASTLDEKGGIQRLDVDKRNLAEHGVSIDIRLP
jgi:ureidoglycolate lyase